ncbi:hypothetical protein TWF106_008914 [Orbilia oligospora]|uniref:Carbohydrate kinase PfkB domain-containing protein n=1 Tax=Orbilia oligospora TaxID=2813651 RepID=A0A7C8TUL0_ORBOL|nr:hypothetical protein TWF788_006641 [Orbilia oligospora]KAF3214745.1 hypothetical protein TWF106_008914 [Orbilia oligospora]
MTDTSESSIHFVTLGMFIIDQIHFPASGRVVDNIIGGAGTFGIIGARLFSPPPKLSRTIGWIVDVGNDFPDDIKLELKRWGTSLVLRETPERKTTRGWNSYGPADFRSFKYLTPKLRLAPDDFANTPLINSLSFHLICSPNRCRDIINTLSSLRSFRKEPVLIWEPVPNLCTPEELPACLEVLKLVSVVSPNAAELGGFYGLSESEAEKKVSIETNAEKWYVSGIGLRRNGPIIVRAGKGGCYIRYSEGGKWLPAYFDEEHNSRVVDPTGGGNCFIGGLAIGLVRTGDIILAAAYATVAASFAIEQIGMPVLSQTGKTELWNGVEAKGRLKEYLQRIGMEKGTS